MQKEVNLLNKDQDNQRTDDNQHPMKYQQFVPNFPPVGPGQRPPGGPSSGPGQRPPGVPSSGPGQRPPGVPSPGPGQRPPGGPSSGPGQRPPGVPSPSPGQRPPGGPSPSPGQRPPGRPSGQPPSAPPSFIPQLPREAGQDVRGPSGGPFIGFQRPSRDFRSCMNRFTYIWLINGNNFWFYPVFASRNFIEGFRWRRNRWEYERINTNRILFHICF